MEASGYKLFNDSVHGHITLHPLLVKVVDTPEFQRLRNIKQLGVSNFVFPSAGHSRFEHSLGTCYLAGQMVEKLFRRDKARGRTEEEEKKLMLCVQMAALCHDLGHGPFSHTWEVVVGHSGGSGWKHEQSSTEMFDLLVQENCLTEHFDQEDLKKRERDIVKELIMGGPEEGEKHLLTGCNKFLYEIVSSKKTGIDVDKWDYFLRDGLHLNLPITFDCHRILEFCTVLPAVLEDGSNKDVDTYVAFRDKEVMNLYDMYRVRSALHHTAYRHKVVINIELMFADAFKAAWDANYRINNSSILLKDAHTTAANMSKLTDHIFYDILYSTEPSESLAMAQTLFQRVLKRKLYKFVGKASIQPPQNVSKFQTWINEEKSKLKERLETEFKNLNFRIGEFFLNLDSKNNPVSKAQFYQKERGTNKIKKQKYKDIKKELLPFPFQLAQEATAQLLVFCTKEDVTDDELQEAKVIIENWQGSP